MSLVTVVGFVWPVQTALAPAASAAGPEWSPLLRAEAAPAWGFLETQATDVLAAHGLPTDTTEQYTRALIRSYLFGQLMGIVDKAHAGQTLSSEEQEALTYLEEQVREERHWAALDAYAKYWTFATAQQSCLPGTGPLYTDGSTGMGGIGRVFAQAFGNQPSAPAFNAVGFAEATQAFEDPEAASVFFDTAYSLSYWSTLQVVDGESQETATLEEGLRDILKEKLAEAGKEGLQELGTALFEVAAGQSGAASWAVAAAALAVIIASGIWNRQDNFETAAALEENAAETPEVGVDQLAALLTPTGSTELFYVVLAQTLSEGTAIPAQATAAAGSPARSRPTPRTP